MRTISLVLNSLLAALCITTATHLANAQTSVPANDVPRTISYQGLLTNADGSAVHDGEYHITLSLYADPAGAVKIWQDTYSTPVTGGIFNLYVGSGNVSLPDPATMNRPLWVGIQLDDSPPMYPLTPLSASPYALNVPDRAITTGKLADGSVTAEKVGMDYIAGIAVNGETVTSKGTVLNIEGSDDIALTFNDATNTLRLSRPAPGLRGDDGKGANTLAVADAVWSLNGDGWDISSSTTVTPAPGDFIGTINNLTFEARTYNQTAMRYQPSGTNTPNIIGGYGGNSITAASFASVIAGGGEASFINQITNNANYAVIGGGDYNTVSNSYSTIGGGHQNAASGQFSTAAGGAYHIVSGYAATVGGGAGNTASDFHSTVGGGEENVASGSKSTVGGGRSNSASGIYSTVGGGYTNTATNDFSSVGGGSENIASGIKSRVGGGEHNSATGLLSTIGGGSYNSISGSYAAIAGGSGNNASNSHSAVGGGELNAASGNHSFVGGGEHNTASGYIAGIGSGSYNNASNAYTFVGGGQTNVASATHAAVAGGLQNTAAGNYSSVGGGTANSVWGISSLISGGDGNVIDGVSDYSSIVGGEINRIKEEAQYAFVGGGTRNHISGSYSVIGGGDSNVVTSFWSTIAGGTFNRAEGQSSTVTGGENNKALSNAVTGFIGGGRNNTISNSATVIAGGEYSMASGYGSAIGGGAYHIASGNYSTIPGGDHLQTTGYAQTAAGFYNAARGTLTSRPTAAAVLLNNDPLFMIGNGGSGGPRSNAFEVSYNGHSVVYGTNGGVNNPIKGATYTDNIVYAWGDIGVFGAINSDFGVTNVLHPAPGVYIITINVVDPLGNPVILNNAAITATLAVDPLDPNPDPFRCSNIRVTRMGVPGANQFTVYTIGAPTDGHCEGVNSAFMFHVTGRQ